MKRNLYKNEQRDKKWMQKIKEKHINEVNTMHGAISPYRKLIHSKLFSNQKTEIKRLQNRTKVQSDKSKFFWERKRTLI